MSTAAGPIPSIAEVTAALTAPGSMFELDTADVRGVTFTVWKNCPPSLRSILELSSLHGDKTFLVYEDERMTFTEHFGRAARFARVLTEELGVRKGDRVAIAMRNFPEWSVAFWGAAAVGAVIVPLNAWWTGPELEYGLTDSGATVLVVDAERLARLAPHLATMPGMKTVVVRPDGPTDAYRWDDLVREPASTLPDVAIEPDDDATIFYTSGTTGRPKGALGTQRNICTNLLSLGFTAARAAARSGKTPGTPGPQPAMLLSVPLFHATGCHSVLVGNTASGGKLVMMHKWDPERALELIERERLTSFGGVPAMVWQVLDSPDFEKRDTSSVQGVSYGGAPAPPELVKRIGEHFPKASAGNGYGLTETSSMTTYNAGADYVAHPDSVGVPVPVCELKIVDESGAELPIGGVGELWIKGPNVVKGYWGKPEATAESFNAGWLKTGDVARIDDEGFVFIVDRAKDMVIRGGENVYCVEVEGAIFEHPDVVDAAVIGVPHQVLGEEVGAIVQLRPGTVGRTGDKELAAFVRERLAGFKVPQHWWFVDDPLPRNPAGKVLKRELRESVLGPA
ncbi:MAG: class I adenylate-forming enzyme family protein [Acidimicrobiales bacterium]